MAAEPRTSPARAEASSSLPLVRRLTAGGTTGNERLTAATGAVLIVLLAILGVTILRLRNTLLWLHLFVGIALIGPVALKLAATGYRFVRYYTHNAAYRLKGPPLAWMRALAPAVVVTTLVVFASGVALLFAGPSSRDALLPVHKVSFIAWLVVTGLHVLGHLAEMPAPLRADWSRASRLDASRLGGDVAGRSGRALTLAGALVAGFVLAILLIPEFAPWIHWNDLFHAGDH
jgi:hypothetical protein